MVAAQRPDGRIQYFDAAGNELLRYGGALERLEALGVAAEQGWRYITRKDTVERYDAAGRLLSITHRGGHTQTLVYDVPFADGGDDDPDTLDQVVGPFGRRLLFAYDERGRLITVTAPGQAHYRYGYDEHGNLISVTYPDETPEDESDNPMRRYHYEDARFAHALTGITDENNKRFATYAYDAQGRAILSEHAGGAGRVAITYNPDGSSTATDALRNRSTYHFALVHGVLKPTEVGRPCPEATGIC